MFGRYQSLYIIHFLLSGIMRRFFILILSILSFACEAQDEATVGPWAPTGLQWLQQNAYLYHDYTNSSQAIGTALSNGDVGLEDLSPNNIDATVLNGVVASAYQFYGKPVTTFKDNDNDALNIGQGAALESIFQNGDFEIHLHFAVDDGQTAASYNIMGVLNTTAAYLNMYVETNGRFNFAFGTNFSTTLYNWQTSAGFFANGWIGGQYIRIRVDHTNNTITLYRNGRAVSGSVNSGTIASIDPSLWNTSQDVYIGALNNAGTITTNTNIMDWFRVAITPLDPPEYVQQYIWLEDFAPHSDWSEQFHITPSNATTTREAIIDAIFAEGTLPTSAVPTSSTTVTGTIHGISLTTDITGEGTVTRFIWDRDGASNRIYRIEPSSGAINEAILYSLGHSSINDKLAINSFLAAGYDVFLCGMADSGDAEDLSDNTASGTWTPVGGGNHNEMSSLNVAGLSYFLYDKINMLNWMDANASYAHVYMAGTSGGGWTTLLCAALDERIEKAFPVRGYKPRIYKIGPPAETSASDYEQGGSNGSSTGSGAAVYNFFTTYTYEDLVALASTNGRTLYTITHTEDTALLGGTTFNIWKTTAESLASSLGGFYKLFLNTASGEGTHSVYQDEIDVILAEL